MAGRARPRRRNSAGPHPGPTRKVRKGHFRGVRDVAISPPTAPTAEDAPTKSNAQKQAYVPTRLCGPNARIIDFSRAPQGPISRRLDAPSEGLLNLVKWSMWEIILVFLGPLVMISRFGFWIL